MPEVITFTPNGKSHRECHEYYSEDEFTAMKKAKIEELTLFGCSLAGRRNLMIHPHKLLAEIALLKLCGEVQRIAGTTRQQMPKTTRRLS